MSNTENERASKRLSLGLKHSGVPGDDVLPPEGFIRLIDAVAKTCRWPHWDNPHFCCAETKLDGFSYCLAHQMRSLSAYKSQAGGQSLEEAEAA